jgi:hypothetical protein
VVTLLVLVSATGGPCYGLGTYWLRRWVQCCYVSGSALEWTGLAKKTLSSCFGLEQSFISIQVLRSANMGRLYSATALERLNPQDASSFARGYFASASFRYWWPVLRTWYLLVASLGAVLLRFGFGP